jgi:FkbM family methyltransferase
VLRPVRRVIDQLMARLPPAPRRASWRLRRELGRRRRRLLEAKGDWSRSRPALHDLDQILPHYLQPDGGFFVEAGAADGYFQSNTYWLERNCGWRGVLVEPVPSLAAEAARERQGSKVFNCALVAADVPGAVVRLKYRGAMTVVDGPLSNDGSKDAWEQFETHDLDLDAPQHTFTVAARTLTSVLDEASAPPIDFMSLDVEGFEGEVLKGLDLDRYGPRWLLVETNNDSRREQAIWEVLGQRYREVARPTQMDLLLARES